MDILCDIQFLDINNGWAVGHSSHLLKTVDGGTNWFNLNFGTRQYYSVHFIDQNIGWFTSNNGIFKTTNGGADWFEQPRNTSLDFRTIFFIDNNKGWVASGNGTILNTTNGGVTFIEDEENNLTQPKDFLLEQNYPNPFNPSTKIKFTIPSVETHRDASLLATLKVYDILGNEVATLVNEYRGAGNYEVDFQSTVSSHQLANGVYFYRLQVGDFVETKKMLLLK